MFWFHDQFLDKKEQKNNKPVMGGGHTQKTPWQLVQLSWVTIGKNHRPISHASGVRRLFHLEPKAGAPQENVLL